MRNVVTALAMLLLLGVFPVSALAQQPQAGPDADRMAQMMKMMEQMQGHMKACHGPAAAPEPK